MSNSDMMILHSLELNKHSEPILEPSLNQTSSLLLTRLLKSREKKNNSKDGDQADSMNGTVIMMEHLNGLPTVGLRSKDL